MKHIESAIQQACIKWFRQQYPRYALNIVAVPNGGARNAREAKIMKGEGVTAGVADVILFLPNTQYHGLCIEFKHDKTATSAKTYQRQSQKDWQAAVEAVGYRYEVLRSFDEFYDIIMDYMRG